MHIVLQDKEEESLRKVTLLSKVYILVCHKIISVPLRTNWVFFLKEAPL